MSTTETTMPHGAPAESDKSSVHSYAGLIVQACDDCREVISLSSKLRRQFPRLEKLERALIAESLEHLGRCAYELAAQLREGK